MPPSKHAKIGGSNLKQALACTPSIRMQEAYPDEVSEAAAEGTLAHAIAEEHLRQLLGHKKIKTSARHKADPLYRPVMEDYVEVYTDYVLELYEEAKESTPDALLLIEEHVDFGEYVPGGYGTSDVVLIADNVMHIVDLKYGKGVPVSAEGNPQLRIYALGALNSYDMLYSIDTVVMHIVQPRLDSITTDQIRVQDLKQWGTEYVKPRAEMALRGEGTTVPGDHCKFCRCKVTCRAYNQRMLEVGDIMQDDRQPNELSNEEIAMVLDRASEIASWARTVKKWAEDQAINLGKEFPGFKVVEGRSNRAIVDEDAAFAKLIEAGYAPADVMEMVGISGLEERIGKKNLAEILGDLIIKPAGKPTLVKESDKRPAINSSERAQAMFTSLD